MLAIVNASDEEDHPRIRGEYRNFSRFTYRALGSPPHTRGIHAKYKTVKYKAGITPAYAGNTAD